MKSLQASTIITALTSLTLLIQAASGHPALIPTALLAHVWVGPLSLLAGGRMHPQFQMWQPFQGGTAFVGLQAVGWAMYSTAIVLGCCIMLNWNAPSAAALGFTGILSVSSAGLLIASLHHFDTTTLARAHSRTQSNGRLTLTTRVSLMLSLTGACLLAAADAIGAPISVLPSWVVPPPEASIVLLLFGLGSFYLSALLTHGLQGALLTPGYRLYMPFEGGTAFVLLHAFSWFFFSLMSSCAFASLPRLRVGIGVQEQTVSAAGVLTLIGSFGLTSQLLLICALPVFDPNAPDHLQLRVHTLGSAKVARDGWSLLPLIHVLMPCFTAESLLSSICLCSSTVGFTVLDLALGDGSRAIDLIDARSLAKILMLLMHASGPLAHAAGCRVHRGYRLWQPFRGGPLFVTAQMFGWLLHSISLFLMTIEFFLPTASTAPACALRPETIRVVVPMSVAAQLLLINSLRLFLAESEGVVSSPLRLRPPAPAYRSSAQSGDGDGARSHTRPGERRGEARGGEADGACWAVRVQHAVGRASQVAHVHASTFDAEAGVALLVCLTGFVFAAVFDLPELEHPAFSLAQALPHPLRRYLAEVAVSRRGELAVSSMVAQAGSCVGMHLAHTARARATGATQLSTFQPFEGGVSFVVWQAIGWTGYSCMLLIQLIIFGNCDEKLAGTSQAATSALQGQGVFAATSAGVVLAHCVLQCSYACFDPEQLRLNPSSQSTPAGTASDFGFVFMASLLSFGAVYTADVFHRAALDTPSLALLHLGVCFNAMAAAAIVRVGRRLYGANYRVLMPFGGGFRFSLLQAIGWTLTTIGVCGLLLCAYIGVLAIKVDGLIAALGVCAAFGHGCLATSVRYFEFDSERRALSDQASHAVGALYASPSPRSDDAQSDARPNAKSHLLNPHQGGSQGVPFACVVGGVACLILVLSDVALLVVGPAFPLFPVVGFATTLIFASVPLYFADFLPDFAAVLTSSLKSHSHASCPSDAGSMSSLTLGGGVRVGFDVQRTGGSDLSSAIQDCPAALSRKGAISSKDELSGPFLWLAELEPVSSSRLIGLALWSLVVVLGASVGFGTWIRLHNAEVGTKDNAAPSTLDAIEGIGLLTTIGATGLVAQFLFSMPSSICTFKRTQLQLPRICDALAASNGYRHALAAFAALLVVSAAASTLSREIGMPFSCISSLRVLIHVLMSCLGLISSLFALLWAAMLLCLGWRCLVPRGVVLVPSARGMAHHDELVCAVLEDFRRLLMKRSASSRTLGVLRATQAESAMPAAQMDEGTPHRDSHNPASSLDGAAVHDGAGTSGAHDSRPPQETAESDELNLTKLHLVIELDESSLLMHVEPGLRIGEMVRIALAHNFVPLVVPIFPDMSVGAAFCTRAVGAGSHAFGSFADVTHEVDVLVPSLGGTLLRKVSREHLPDLFTALSQGFGDTGVITRLAVQLRSARPFEQMRYRRFRHATEALDMAERLSDIDDRSSPSLNLSGVGHEGGLSSAALELQAPLAGESICDGQAPSRVQPQGNARFVDLLAVSHDEFVVVEAEMCCLPARKAKFVSLRANRWDPWFTWHVFHFVKGGELHDDWHEWTILEDFLFRYERGGIGLAGPLLHSLRRLVLLAAPCLGFPEDMELVSWEPSLSTRLLFGWIGSFSGLRLLFSETASQSDELLHRSCVLQDFELETCNDVGSLLEHISRVKARLWPVWICPRARRERQGVACDCEPSGGVRAIPSPTRSWFVGVYAAPVEPFDPIELNGYLEEVVCSLGGTKRARRRGFVLRPSVQRLLFGDVGRACTHQRVRHSYGAVGVFQDIESRLLLPEQIINQCRGTRLASELNAERRLSAWYLLLWREVVMPHSVYSRLGVQHARSASYACFPIIHSWQVPGRFADNIVRSRRLEGRSEVPLLQHQRTPPSS